MYLKIVQRLFKYCRELKKVLCIIPFCAAAIDFEMLSLFLNIIGEF
jgi:hypothetical protein